MQAVTLIIPVYNEASSLPSFLENLRRFLLDNPHFSETIFVDDGSNDGTAGVLDGLSAHERITVLRHASNQGYGAALKTGINQAANDLICIIDPDTQYCLNDIGLLTSHLPNYEMIVGARIGKASQHFPSHQRIAKRTVCSLLSLFCGQKILDINSGLRIFRKSLAEHYSSVLSNSFSFTSGITVAALLEKKKILYVPVSYSQRIGKSKVRSLSYSYHFVVGFCRVLLHKLNQNGEKF